MSQQTISLLLGVTQSAYNFYETGKREIPAYIQREIAFFQALSKREQQRFIHEVNESNGEQVAEGDERGREQI